MRGIWGPVSMSRVRVLPIDVFATTVLGWAVVIVPMIAALLPYL